MDTMQTFTYSPQSQPPITNQQALYSQQSHHASNNSFPVLAIAILSITATAFLLVSYYIYVTKCCFRWQQLDTLRRFSIRQRQRRSLEDPLTSYSPSWQSRGLNELLIRDIPSFQFCKNEGEFDSLSKCVVCLNEFQDHEMLRVLPKCSHAFHLDCIDIWLQNNSNCPLCRSTISGRNGYQHERLVAPNSSPQEMSPLVGSFLGGDEDFLVIEICGEDGNGGLVNGQEERGDSRRFLVQPRSHSSRKIVQQKLRKIHHLSIMGDEGINVKEKADQFGVKQPIRRSFSMDSAVDRHVYLSVQEIIRQSRHDGREVIRDNEESNRSNSISGRRIFSFGRGRGSRNAVLPTEF